MDKRIIKRNFLFCRKDIISDVAGVLMKTFVKYIATLAYIV